MFVRFHLDEHISFHIAAGLRRRKIDVTTPADSGLIGATDMEHLVFASAQRRVVVTHDGDFLRLHAQGVAHTGIAEPASTLAPSDLVSLPGC